MTGSASFGLSIKWSFRIGVRENENEDKTNYYWVLHLGSSEAGAPWISSGVDALFASLPSWIPPEPWELVWDDPSVRGFNPFFLFTFWAQPMSPACTCSSNIALLNELPIFIHSKKENDIRHFIHIQLLCFTYLRLYFHCRAYMIHILLCQNHYRQTSGCPDINVWHSN